MNKQQIIQTYLCYGYLPPAVLPDWIDSCITKQKKGTNYDDEEVIERLDLAFDQLLKQ